MCGTTAGAITVTATTGESRIRRSLTRIPAQATTSTVTTTGHTTGTVTVTVDATTVTTRRTGTASVVLA